MEYKLFQQKRVGVRKNEIKRNTEGKTVRERKNYKRER